MRYSSLVHSQRFGQQQNQSQADNGRQNVSSKAAAMDGSYVSRQVLTTCGCWVNPAQACFR
jgi:hypothetical protein